MRTLSLILPVSLLVLASGASAQEQEYPATAPAQVSRVEVTAPFHFDYDEADAISGRYQMSNGWRMKVDSTYNGIAAQIDNRRAIKLIAVGPDRYVSADGNVSMEFNHGGDADEMLMSYVPDVRTAQVVVVRATLAQR